MSPIIKVHNNGDIEGEASEVIQYFKELNPEKTLKIPSWSIYLSVAVYILSLIVLFCFEKSSTLVSICKALNVSAIVIGCALVYYKTKIVKGILLFGTIAFLIFIYAIGQISNETLGEYGRHVIESQINNIGH